MRIDDHRGRGRVGGELSWPVRSGDYYPLPYLS